MGIRYVDAYKMTTVIEELDPYIGPRFFIQEQSDRARFFGRNRETDDIVSLILGHNLVLVYAASGVGKTSIFNAKVIPTLREEYGLVLVTASRLFIAMSCHRSSELYKKPRFYSGKWC